MAGVNRVILLGNLGKDPEIMTFDNGVKKASFSLATSESYKNKEGNRVDQTEWHNIVMWRGLAEIAEKYFKKGSQVYIEGKIKTRSYEQDGIKKYVAEIYADNFSFVGKREDSSGGDYKAGSAQAAQQASQPPASNDAPIEAPEDDLPF